MYYIGFYKSKNVLMPDFSSWVFQPSRFLMGCTAWRISVADSHHWANLKHYTCYSGFTLPKVAGLHNAVHIQFYEFEKVLMPDFAIRHLGASAIEIPCGVCRMEGPGC